MIRNSKFKILVLVGPTSSGKSELAVSLAKKFNGEIISADSRQVYKGMDLGTGKITGRWKNNRFVYKSIPHYLIDFVNPGHQYSAALFQRDAKKIIANILERGKLPIICGGTAHWIDALVYNQQLPDVKPNAKLRAQLQKKSADKLFVQLQKLDPHRAKNIDRHNKHRLIRALEIIITTGKPVPISPPFQGRVPSEARRGGWSPYNILWLGIKTSQPDLYKKIDARLKQRLKAGMVKEVERLHSGSPLPLGEGLGVRVQRRGKGLSWRRLESFGLEYKFISFYLQKKLPYDGMLTQLSYAIKHYSKRQLTWWKKNKEIKWLDNQRSANKLVAKFLK